MSPTRRLDYHDTNEQALRREAIRWRLQGQSRRDICRDLNRATSWFDKWWAHYRQNPDTDFASRSPAPHHSPQQMPAHAVAAVVGLRQLLEAASTPSTRYGLIGARAIWTQLKEFQLARRLLDAAPGQDQPHESYPSAAQLGIIGAALPAAIRQRRRILWRTHPSAHPRSGGAQLSVLWGRAAVYALVRTQAQLSDRKLPLCVGQQLLVAPLDAFIIMRKVDSTGAIKVLNEVWRLGLRWSGEYVRATINTQEQSIGFWHQANAEAPWELIKTRRFAVEEPAHALLPELHRNCT